jgi:enoyl-CoA hydratase
MQSLLRPIFHIRNTPSSSLRVLSPQNSVCVYPRHGTTHKGRFAQMQGRVGSRHVSMGIDKATGPTVLCGIHEHSPGNNVGTITISNPTKLNIVNSELLAQMTAACESLSSDVSLRAVILTGATAPTKAASFIGGADISEMASLDSSDSARAFIMKIHLACKALRDLPVPVIARVNGYALGAGLEIMAACDLRLCTRDSVFGMPEVKVGIPSVVEAALLPGLIGMGRTRRLLYLAENIHGPEAVTWGLVDQAVPDERALDAAVEDWTDKLVGMGPKAIRSQKMLMQKWENCSVEEGIMAGVNAYAEAYGDGGKEAKEMMRKFLNRKK